MIGRDRTRTGPPSHRQRLSASEPPDAREQLLIDVYSSDDSDPGDRVDRERAVARFLQERERRRPRPQRGASARVALAAALTLAISGAAWLSPRSVPAPAGDAQPAAAAAPSASSAQPALAARDATAPERSLPARTTGTPQSAAPVPRTPPPRPARPVLASAQATTPSEPAPLAAAEVPAAGSDPDPRLQAEIALPEPSEPLALDLPSPISIRAPSAAQLQTLGADRANDLSRFLPSLEASRLDPCAEPELRGAALEDTAPETASQIDGKCRGL